MPYRNSYNESIAHTIHQINQRKVDHENLCNDNIEGGSRIALKTHLDTGFGPTLDLPVGSGMSAGKKPRATRRKKGGDLNDVLDTVGKIAPLIPLAMGLGKKPRKKGGVILGMQGPYKSGESDVPDKPHETTAVSAAKRLVLSKPVPKSEMPSNIGGGMSAGGVSAGGVSAGKKTKKPVSDKMKNRNELIKKLMKEKGMSLPQASKHIKEANLAY